MDMIYINTRLQTLPLMYSSVLDAIPPALLKTLHNELAFLFLSFYSFTNCLLICQFIICLKMKRKINLIISPAAFPQQYAK